MTSPQPAPRRARRRPPAPPAPDQYPNYVAFFEEELRWYYQRNLGAEQAWCPQWRLHSEATARITELHRSWEVANRDGGSARALWWVNICDPMMRELFDPSHTFKGCSVDKGHRPEAGNGPLPSTAG